MDLLSFLALIFSFNLLTFGNGPTMVPLIQESMVDERGWLTSDQLLYAFAIARVTPGQANVYVAAVGYLLFGWLGAVMATLAIMVPGYMVLPLLGGFRRVRENSWVRGFTGGLTAGSVGLIFAATISIGQRSLTSPIAVVVFATTLLFNSVLRWGPIVSLLAASVLGLVLHFLF